MSELSNNMPVVALFTNSTKSYFRAANYQCKALCSALLPCSLKVAKPTYFDVVNGIAILHHADRLATED